MDKVIKQLTSAKMRDYIISAHGLATGNYIQSDTEIKKRIGKLLQKAIESDDVMLGFMGYGGKCSERDMLNEQNILNASNLLDDA